MLNKSGKNSFLVLFLILEKKQLFIIDYASCGLVIYSLYYFRIHSLYTHFAEFFCRLFVCLVFFLGRHLQHMEVPRLGDESGLQLLAYTTATATLTIRQHFPVRHNFHKYYLLQSSKLPCETGSNCPVSHEKMRYRPGIQT